jgi:DNA polymerase V
VLLRSLAPDVEAYSVDEAFVHLFDSPDAAEQAKAVRATVKRWTGLPTRVGIGATKTLAKIAGGFASSIPTMTGCLI